MKLRIVCTDQVPYNEPTTHAHIVAVGIDTDFDGFADDRATKETVIRNIKNGTHYYYTTDPSGRNEAAVEVVGCGKCGNEIIRSTPDATTSNNLDFMRRCKWGQQ